MVLVGCGACGSCGACGGAELQVVGPHPYRRCRLVEPRDAEGRVGNMRFVQEDGELKVEGAEALLGYSLGPGADPSGLPSAVHLVLGGFARPDASNDAVAATRGLVLLLPGGADDNEAMDTLLETLDAERFVDLRGVRRVRFSGLVLDVVPGAPQGRYALGDGACGFARDDLGEPLADEDESVLLASWAAPLREGRLGVDRGFGGVHTGDPALAEYARDYQGGLHAWPRTASGWAYGIDGVLPAGVDAEHLEVVVPTLGLVTERFDESRLAGGAVWVRWSDAGLRWEPWDPSRDGA